MTVTRFGVSVYKLVRQRRRGHTGALGGAGHFYKITVPAEVGDLVPEGTVFVPELVEEGILLRRFESEADVPAWALPKQEQPARRRRIRRALDGPEATLRERVRAAKELSPELAEAIAEQGREDEFGVRVFE